MKRQSGFTLIEMLVVVSIITILTGIGLATYSAAQKKSRDSRRMADLESVRSALEIYRADNPAIGYPGTNYEGLPLTPNYLSELPTDPQPPAVYIYTGGGNTYSLCATREVLTPLSYCLTPP